MIKFRKIAKISLVLVYLVIIAGAVVRMTGSGMGCPDWPKCFGHYIPPTQASELEWQPNHDYNKGQVIILNETLQVAKEDLKTSDVFDSNNWEAYTKHDYAEFNPWHTWIEFINRLLGALAGLATLILAISSLGYWKKNKSITAISWLVVFAMGFQGWLGATVVYSVLEPVKITMHMVMALFIVALLVYLIFITDNRPLQSNYDKNVAIGLWVALALSMFQIVLGTQVRQFVDHQIDLFGENDKAMWLQDPSIQFYIHRSLSILVVLVNVSLAYYIYKNKLDFSKFKWVLGILFLEVLSGVVMYYFDFPFASQPLHLIMAALLFGIQFYLVLEATKVIRSRKTS